jgi:hypothetical protein
MRESYYPGTMLSKAIIDRGLHARRGLRGGIRTVFRTRPKPAAGLADDIEK